MERDPFRNVKWFVLGYFVLLILILTFIGICGQLGYVFIDMGLACGLFGLLICSALVAGTVWLVRRFYSKAAKILTGSIGVLLTFAAAIGLVMLCSLLLNFGIASHYTTLMSENGGAVVILRAISTDEELRDLRMEEIGESTDENTINFSALGYSYSAYPRVMRFFYNAKQPAAGELEIGCASEALLKYEWADADTLHLYIENAGIGDVGELTLNLN